MRTDVWPTEKLTTRGIHLLSTSDHWADRLPWTGRVWLHLRAMWHR